MKRIWDVLGIIGLCLLLGGILTPQFYPAVGKWFWLPVALGAAAILAFLISQADILKVLSGKRTARYGINALIYVVVFIGIMVFVLMISAKHFKSWDFTADKRYSLTSQTKKIMANLKQPINVKAFYSDVKEDKSQAESALKMYASLSPNFKYEFIDPDRNPAAAKKYDIKAYGTLVLESGGKQEKIYSTEEDKLTNAILKVTFKGKSVVYFLTGHGEPSLEGEERGSYSSVKKALENEQYEIKNLELYNHPEGIPKDASALIVAGAKKPLFEPEFTDLEKYLHHGGRVLFLLEPNGPEANREFMKKFGIVARNDLIIDQMSRLSVGDYFMPMVTQYQRHPITEGFTYASLFPTALSLTETEKGVEGVITTPIASTSENSWGETDIGLLSQGKAAFDNGKDVRGPLPIVMAATINNADAGTEKQPEAVPAGKAEEKAPKPPEGRMVVFGDSDFADNTHLGMSGNKDFLLNSIGWLAEKEELIAIRPKEDKMQPVFLNPSQQRLVFFLPVVVVPLIVIITGVSVVVVRRRKG